jgi:hypothetical protein
VIRRAVVALAFMALVAGAVPALAQDGGTFFVILFDSHGTRDFKQWDLPVRWEGSVTVRFESSFGTGEIVWTPGPEGQFTAGEAQRNGRYIDGFLASTGGAGVTARVETPNRACTDTSGGELFDQAAIEGGKDGVRVALAGTTPASAGFHMTDTQCGGPLADDIGRALGKGVSVRRAQLVKGSFDIDLRSSAPLFAPGMKGTVASTVVAHVGAREPGHPESPERARPGGTNLMSVNYRVLRMSGRMDADFAGGGELCAELASCGAHETIALDAGRPRHASFSLSAYASGKRPLADLRAALGLPHSGGSANGIDWVGTGELTSRSTLVSAALLRDGNPVCKDQRHLPSLQLFLQRSGARIDARLSAGIQTTLRTSCPGPALWHGAVEPILASGSLPLSALRRKQLTLRLTRGHSLATDGWSGRTRANFTIVLRRTSVSKRHFNF